MDVINRRRSIRRFKPGQAITPQQIELLLRAAMQAPSAKKKLPWEFVVITDRNILSQLANLLPRCEFFEDAGAVILVASNLEVPKTAIYHQDLAACTQNILLEATNLNLGSCWIGVYGTDRMLLVETILKLPPKVESFALVAIGHLVNDDDLYLDDRFNPDLIHYNGW